MDLCRILLLTGAWAAVPAAAQSSEPASKPPLAPSAQAALIEEVRTNTLNYSQRLPDFLCTEVTRRYSAPVPASGDASWKKREGVGHSTGL